MRIIRNVPLDSKVLTVAVIGENDDWAAYIGALFVSLGNPLYANLIWSVSNPLMAQYNYKIQQKEQSLLFIVFTIIAWFGVFNLLWVGVSL